MQGWLNLNKPKGISSTGALNKIKWLLKQFGVKTKIGHAGTLDPLASGVLPVALGGATRLVEYLMGESKEYEFTILWGESTDTLDAEGSVVASSVKRPSLAELESVLKNYKGEIEQVPPKYSAIKVDGIRAYEAARKDISLKLKARTVFLKNVQVLQHIEQETSIKVECGKGFYIRSLARDIIADLGCEGHVSDILRTRVGNFDLRESISLDVIEESLHNLGNEAILKDVIKPMQFALDDISVQMVSSAQKVKLGNGQKVPMQISVPNKDIVFAKFEESIIAVCQASDGFLIPLKVFKNN